MAQPLALLHQIADPARKRIITALQCGERAVGDIVAEVGIRQSGVSRHLQILHGAGVVTVRKDGQRRLYALRPEPFVELQGWIDGYRALWSTRLDQFGAALAAVPLGQPDEAAKDRKNDG